MDETLPNTTISTDATLFREEAERARRYAAAMIDKKVIDRLNEIAALYDERGRAIRWTDRSRLNSAVLHQVLFRPRSVRDHRSAPSLPAMVKPFFGRKWPSDFISLLITPVS